jgi:hypothetical protein
LVQVDWLFVVKMLIGAVVALSAGALLFVGLCSGAKVIYRRYHSKKTEEKGGV